ncbi:hypothetical protein B0H13DRAFT_2337680 [Mycena leptocephala]|nr:hypothetical protein B0H13DRAFT_2337680 [Mycena leptocephala]
MPCLFSHARTASTPSKSKHRQPLPTLSAHFLPAFSSNALLIGSPTVRTPVDEFGVNNLTRTRSAGAGGASAPGEAGPAYSSTTSKDAAANSSSLFATPFVSSAPALTVSRSGVVRLVNAFLATCKDPHSNGSGHR